MDVPSYDEQATGFDTRVGLGPEVCRAIAAHVAERVGDDRCLEWGCGTGEIGIHLAAMTDYSGFDRSPTMLSVFKEREPSADLRLADGDERWPVPDGAAVVFGSRSLHLMAPEHVASECRRVARLVLIGRVERDRDGLRDRMRRDMHRLLRERGYTPRDGRSRNRGLSARLPFGAPVRVVSWSVAHSAVDALEAWRGKPGLAGITPEPRDKRDILEELAVAFADRGTRQRGEEWYTVAEACLQENP